MAHDWQDVKAAIDAENERIRLDPPPEIVKIFQYGIIESGAGTHGQCMSAWVFIAGDTRYLAFYGTNNIVALAANDEFTLEHLKAMTAMFVPLSAEFLGYCGHKRLWELVRDVMSALDTLETKDDFVELMSSLCLYTAHLNMWIQHYFKWELGTLFPHVDSATVDRMHELTAVR